MNLESLKNMDVNDLLLKFKNQSDIFKDKKLMIKIGVGLGSILIFLISSLTLSIEALRFSNCSVNFDILLKQISF